jgi:hypothetical protein
LSSLVEIPAGLCLVLSLAAAGADAPPRQQVLLQTASQTPPARGASYFDKQGWLHAIKTGAGQSAGDDLANLRTRIFLTSGGRYYVPERRARRHILAFRARPEIAGRVAFGLARMHREILTRRLARLPTAAELFIAHRLGLQGLAQLGARSGGAGRASRNTGSLASLNGATSASRAISRKHSRLAAAFSSQCGSPGPLEAATLLSGAYRRLATALSAQSDIALFAGSTAGRDTASLLSWTTEVRVATQ